MRFPTSFTDIGDWAKNADVPVAEARIRYAQYHLLHAIAGSRQLREVLVFKGGNALDFVLEPNRSTTDLDFTLNALSGQSLPNADALERQLQTTFEQASVHSDLLMEMNPFKQQPPGNEKTRHSFVVRVGYAMRDELGVRQRMQRGLRSSRVIPIEISGNDVVGDSQLMRISPGMPQIRVATAEDIIAEKLRALLQQPIRNRTRRQDVLDIAVMLKRRSDFDLEALAEYMDKKCRARDIEPSRSSFQNPEIKRRAQVEYDELRHSTRVLFIPFEEAWELVIELVKSLPIPE